MLILAVCPYCGQGRVRAPDSAIGLSATCPSCHSCFTLVPSGEPAPIPPVAPRPTGHGVAAAGSALVARTGATPLPPATARPSLRATDALSSTREVAPYTADPALAVALIAAALGGVSLLASQLPYGRLGAALMAGLGTLIGLAALCLAERRRQVPALAAGLNAAVLLVVVVLPGLLGLGAWLPGPAPAASTAVEAIGRDGRVAAVGPRWVDAGKASWQREDVCVTVLTVSVGPVARNGPKGSQQWTAEKYLQVRVRVRNEGVARRIDFRGWGTGGGPESGPRVTDASGRALAAKAPQPGWDPAAQPHRAALPPGKSADQLLLFAPPTAGSDSLHLELPGSAFGDREVVRFAIPRSLVGGHASSSPR